MALRYISTKTGQDVTSTFANLPPYIRAMFKDQYYTVEDTPAPVYVPPMPSQPSTPLIPSTLPPVAPPTPREALVAPAPSTPLGMPALQPTDQPQVIGASLGGFSMRTVALAAVALGLFLFVRK